MKCEIKQHMRPCSLAVVVVMVAAAVEKIANNEDRDLVTVITKALEIETEQIARVCFFETIYSTRYNHTSFRL